MTGAQERLAAIGAELAELDRQQEELARLDQAFRARSEQRSAQDRQVQALRLAWEKEQGDVELLEGVTVQGLLLRLSGRREERLDQEHREERDARSRCEQAQAELERMDQELQRMMSERGKLRTAQGRRKTLLEEKEGILIELGGPTGEELAQISAELTDCQKAYAQLDQACFAGENVMSGLNQALYALDSARDLGTWDMLGGGTLVTLAKHECLDEARNAVHRAQQAMGRFRNSLSELKDLHIPPVSIGEGAVIADYLFDGLIVDFLVQSKIKENQDDISNARYRVKDILGKLQERRQELKTRCQALEQRRAALLSTPSPAI